MALLVKQPGGDGGNRTRVRKNRPSEIYERSLPIVVTAGTPAGWLPCSHLLVFRTVSRIVCGTPPLSRPTRCPVEDGTGGRGLVKETGLSRRSLMQRGAWQRRKCGWHLKFCAEFTRSAPLGSHSGTSLSRRSLSSPGEGGATCSPALRCTQIIAFPC